MRKINYIILVFCLIGVFGCQLTPNFETGYRLESSIVEPSVSVQSLAVRSLEDKRPPRAYSLTGKMFLTYVPLLPYVSLPYERLDENVRIISAQIASAGRGMTWGPKQTPAPPFEEYYYPVSFAKAIAKDLQSSGLFSEVKYVEDESVDNFRYVLTGELYETPYTIKTSTYCLGAAGIYLWILPIMPVSKGSGKVNVELKLTDQKTGKVIWEKIIESEVSKFYTLYTSSAMIYGRKGAFSLNVLPPPSDSQVNRRSLFSWHFEALRRGMIEAKKDLLEKLQNYSE